MWTARLRGMTYNSHQYRACYRSYLTLHNGIYYRYLSSVRRSLMGRTTY